MLTKKFIFENDDETEEISDFEKILRLNKGKISFLDAEFYNSRGESFNDIIDVRKDGIYFTFDDLKEYLGFFFPEMYGEEDSDGYYEATYFDSMYYGTWDWNDEIYDISSSDWDEGYIVSSFNSENYGLCEKIAKIINPSLAKKMEGKQSNYGSVIDNEISDMLSTLNLKDSMEGIYTDANASILYEQVPKYIKDMYCDCLNPIGIEVYSCFYTYKMDWSSIILLFAQHGEENDLFLDLLFQTINETNISHLPEYYEVRYNVWDKDAFDKYFQIPVKQELEEILYKIEFEEQFSSKYLEVVKKISKIGGFDRWIHSKDGKYEVRLLSVDPETTKVNFLLSKLGGYTRQKRQTYIDDIINLLYNKTLFDPTQF